MHTNQLKLWTNKILQNTALFTWESHALLEMPKHSLNHYWVVIRNSNRLNTALNLSYLLLTISSAYHFSVQWRCSRSPPFAEGLLCFCSLCQFQAPAPTIYHPFVAWICTICAVRSSLYTRILLGFFITVKWSQCQILAPTVKRVVRFKTIVQTRNYLR